MKEIKIIDAVPEDAIAITNVLKDTKPAIYTAQSKKYLGRERILGAKIPPLNCLWNDVLHFTAV